MARPHFRTGAANNASRPPIIAPPSIPDRIAVINDTGSGPIVPDAPTIDYRSGDTSVPGVRGGLGLAPVVIPTHPAPVKPLVVSKWAEGNLIYRVQPAYPPLARQVRIQGTVELRAIISKAGTIENLIVVSGHPMLVKSALDAVKQWRYRPYLLNNDPIEVETEITVNFLLSGN
jgi:periplasmic protein TonB